MSDSTDTMTAPVKGGVRIEPGDLLVVDAAGLASPYARAAGLRFLGVAYRVADNTAGADGDATVRYYNGYAELDPTGGYTPQRGDNAYGVSPTVMDSPPGPPQGTFIGKVIQPHHKGGKWTVDTRPAWYSETVAQV